MPTQVVFAFWVEVAMVMFTTVLLSQPRLLFPFQSARARAAGTWGGMMLLCMTFCWSVIFGCILAFHDVTLRI